MDVTLLQTLVSAECKILLAKLRDLGFEFEGDEIVDLEYADLCEIRRQLRDTLRTLGGTVNRG